MVWEGLPPTITTREPAREDDRLCLVVVAGDGVTTHALPERGRLTVGRAEGCDVSIDDPEISREHAVVHVGDVVSIEDLRSANGTHVRGRRIPAKQPIPIGVGQVVDVGGAMLVVQLARQASKTRRRLGSHAYFEARLEEACERTAGRRTAFTVLRVSFDCEAPTGVVQEALTSVLRSSDVVASYAPGEYEMLVLDTGNSRAEKLVAELRSKLNDAEVTARIGFASHPRDGATPDGLMAAASTNLARPEHEEGSLILVDGAMKDLYRVVDRIAQGTISVLLLGETGVGKEVVAAQIHQRSPRRSAPFVPFNCAALSDTVVESELFGHEKGAFTGADEPKVGLLESANGGSVFLDEVGDLPLDTQAKLLRVLEQREVMPVGGVRPRPIDVRFIAATNRDLEEAVEAGRFRRDLYYRLNGVMLRVPPLRERQEEIEPLAELFVERVSTSIQLAEPPILSDRALELLSGYGWPGNIRELKNVIERAVLLCDAPEIRAEHLPFDKLSATWSSKRPASRGGGDAHRRRILDALDACAGNQTRAAEMLGISRRTLTKWLGRYDLPRPRKLKPTTGRRS